MRLWKVDLAVVVIVLLAVVTARIQGKGGRLEEEQAFMKRAKPGVEALPLDLGGWRMLEDQPLTERTLAILQCPSHVNRTYGDDATGDRLTMTVLLGPSGPLVSHSPEVCLPSTQYEMLSPSKSKEVELSDGKKLPLLEATFQARDLGRQVVRIYYAWIRPDGTWVAPSNPRWTLGGDLGLVKLQFATVMRGSAVNGGDDVLGGLLDGAGEDNSGNGEDAVERFLRENGGKLRELLAADFLDGI